MIELFIILLIVAAVIYAMSPEAQPDTREEYYTDSRGNPLALLCVGERDDTPPHERILHHGYPHQNPAIEYKVTTVWLFFPITYEYRYYPLTVKKDNDNYLEEIRMNVIEANKKLPNDQWYDVVPMTPKILKSAILRENGEQLVNGVNSKNLDYTLNGKKRL